MTPVWEEGDLEQAYEALRAQATGELPATTPRGLALFLGAGLAAWMTALPRPAPSMPVREPREGDSTLSLGGLSGDLVRVLVEMALGSRKGVWA